MSFGGLRSNQGKLAPGSGPVDKAQGAVTVGNLYTQAFTAALNFIGSFGPTSTTKVFTAALSFIGGMSRFITYPLTATLSFTASLARKLTRSLTAALSFTGALLSGHNYVVSFVARLSFGAFIWYAGSNSVDGGNNTGWSFT